MEKATTTEPYGGDGAAGEATRTTADANVFRLTEKRFRHIRSQLAARDGDAAGKKAKKQRRRKKRHQPKGEGGVKEEDEEVDEEEQQRRLWDEVIDFHQLEANSPTNRALIVELDAAASSPSTSGLPRVTTLYGLADRPGFVFIPNPFTPEEQLRWADRCVRQYVESPPGKTNLAAHHAQKDLDQLFAQAFPTTTTMPTMQGSEARSNAACEIDGEPALPGKRKGEVEKKVSNALLWKLRWTTLGYHYDWTNRLYHEHQRDTFPAELAGLCEYFAAVSGMDLDCQAAIVNYYAPETVLCGHLDDVELTFEAPIVSISLGLSAIFLLGGLSREEKPRAILLRSGDVVVMGGASRLLYHGVPRILQGTLPSSIVELARKLDADEGQLVHVAEYLSTRRININARQVLPKGGSFPASTLAG